MTKTYFCISRLVKFKKLILIVSVGYNKIRKAELIFMPLNTINQTMSYLGSTMMDGWNWEEEAAEMLPVPFGTAGW